MNKKLVRDLYRGLWTNKQEDALGADFLDYGFFYLWLREDGVGKILERYRGRLFEAHANSFSSVNGVVSFRKKYDRPEGNLTKSEIFYEGKTNPETELIEGIWQFGSKTEWGGLGAFYLTNRESLKNNLGFILLKIEETNIKRDIIALQKEFPFTHVNL